jgi:hypothetical protein
VADIIITIPCHLTLQREHGLSGCNLSPNTENVPSLVILAHVCFGVASTATGGPGRQLSLAS